MDLKKLKICHFISADLWAGAENQSFFLLRELKRSGCEVHAILLNDGVLADKLRREKIVFKLFSEDENSFLKLFNKVVSYLQSNSIQVLHTHGYKENILGALLKRRLGIPVLVQTVHGLEENYHGFRDMKFSCYRAIDRFLSNRYCDAFVAVSKDLALRLCSYPKEKIQIIRNTIDIEEFNSVKGEDLSCAGPAISVVGRLVPVKRYDLFLKSAKIIKEEISSAQFYIIGDGPEKTRLQQLSKELGVSDSVHFLGFCENVASLLKSMDLFVLCSAHEGVPLTLLEASVLKVPIVSNDIGGISEILEHEKSVLFVSDTEQDLANGCLRVLQDAELANKLLVNAYNHIINNFSIKSSVCCYTDLYIRLLS